MRKNGLAIHHYINEARWIQKIKRKNVPMIFEGVRLYTAVYNLQLYTPPGPSEVAAQPLGSCSSLEKL